MGYKWCPFCSSRLSCATGNSVPEKKLGIDLTAFDIIRTKGPFDADFHFFFSRNNSLFWFLDCLSAAFIRSSTAPGSKIKSHPDQFKFIRSETLPRNISKVDGRLLLFRETRPLSTFNLEVWSVTDPFCFVSTVSTLNLIDRLRWAWFNQSSSVSSPSPNRFVRNKSRRPTLNCSRVGARWLQKENQKLSE